MKIKGLLLCFLFLFISSVSFYGQTNRTPNKPYNKPMSIFLSVVSPGMGQVYSGQINKGMIIWSSSVLVAGGLIVTLGDLNFYSTGSMIPMNIGFQWKDTLSPTERALGWTFALSYTALYIYNIIDISVYDPNQVGMRFDGDSVQAYYNIHF